MKLERSKQWWLERAKREGESSVSAGLLAIDPVHDEEARAPAQPELEDVRIAFGRFVNLMRRRQGLSVEALAQAANLDIRELVVIEDDVRYIPEPRTVYQLALTFKVPQQRFMQLAGLARVKDASLHNEAVRFAARSESIQKLTKEERGALEAFIAVLSDQPSK
jgi:HTH-type transcriptional regulator, competence development regulator